VKKSDVRIIAATNKNLEDRVKQGLMREDFYYRINVILIRLPALRERKEDIPLLVDYFLEQSSDRPKRPTLSGKILNALYDYDWPGNVRELQNVLQLDLPQPASASLTPDKPLADMERDYILHILARTHWKIEGKQGAAAILGLHPSTLRSRMQKLDIKKTPE